VVVVRTLSRAAASLATTAVVLALAPAAVADDVYHSEHMPLTPVGTAPLRTGFVENIHADGPMVYAQEVYVLNGALPDADFEVHLLAYPFDPACAGTAVGFGFTTLTTNGAGNGRAKRLIRPADVPAELRDATHGVRWEVRAGGVTMYATACTAVPLD
jgi:hypothetical protein